MRDARRCVAECVSEWGEVGWRKESRQHAETNKRKLPPGFQTPARAVAPEKLDRYKGPVETAIKVTRCDPRPTQEQTIQTVLAAKFSGGHGAQAGAGLALPSSFDQQQNMAVRGAAEQELSAVNDPASWSAQVRPVRDGPWPSRSRRRGRTGEPRSRLETPGGADDLPTAAELFNGGTLAARRGMTQSLCLPLAEAEQFTARVRRRVAADGGSICWGWRACAGATWGYRAARRISAFDRSQDAWEVLGHHAVDADRRTGKSGAPNEETCRTL